MKRHKFQAVAWAAWLAGMNLQSALAQSSTNYRIAASVFDQGGGISTSSGARVFDAIGQPGPVGPSASAEYREASGFLAGFGLISAVPGQDEPEIPKEFTLLQNYPNPFNPETVIEYLLPKPADVEMVIYDLKGQKVRGLVRETRPAGRHSIRWDGRSDSGYRAASGFYICRATMRERTEGGRTHVKVMKMILMK